MVADVQHFWATVPAGTAEAAPVTIAIAMPSRIPRTVRIRIPPGPSGTVGFVLAMNGTPIVPSNPGAWYVGDDEAFVWPLEGAPDSGAWEVIAYNTDTNPHTLQFTFTLDVIGTQTPSYPAVVDIAS